MSQWISKLVEKFRNDKNVCLICGKNAGDNPAIVQYKYDGGLGTAPLCDKCAEEMDKDKVGEIDDESI